MHSPSLSSLRAFCAVAEASSFTLAASRLFRTQPALSRQVSQLERELGVELFARHGRRSVSLTPAGQELYVRAQRILVDVNEFHARAKALASGDHGALRVGVHPLLFDRTVPALLTAYAKKWKHISVSVSEGGASSMMARVESRELDVALARYATSDSITAERLFPMYLVAVVSTRHRFARRRSIEAAALQDEPLLVMPPDSGSRILLDQAFREDGLQLRQIKLESSVYGGLVNLATIGHGIAIVLSMVSFEHPDARVIPVLQNGRHLGTWSAVIWHRRSDLPPYARAFIELAVKQTRADFPGKQYGFPPLDEPAGR